MARVVRPAGKRSQVARHDAGAGGDASSAADATQVTKEQPAVDGDGDMEEDEEEDVAELHGGLHSRPNKPDDTCYTFWIGASLTLLGDVFRDELTAREQCAGAGAAQQQQRRHPNALLSMMDPQTLDRYVLQHQDLTRGGFSKHIDSEAGASLV